MGEPFDYLPARRQIQTISQNPVAVQVSFSVYRGQFALIMVWAPAFS
jgi:hypothetical protein